MGIGDDTGAEVHEHDAAAPFPHHVARSHVAVQHVGGVQGSQRPGNRLAIDRDLLDAERPVGTDDVRQRAAVDELHAQTEAAIVLGRVVDLDDVIVLDAGEQAPFHAHAIGHTAMKQFDRETAIQRGVTAQMHGAVTALADWPQQFVTAPAPRGGKVSRLLRRACLGVRIVGWRLSVGRPDTAENLQLVNELTQLGCVRRASELLPVDRQPVRQSFERCLVRLLEGHAVTVL